MIDISTVESVAKILREASVSGIPCEPIRNIIGDSNVELAYAIQDHNSNLRIENGSRIVGKKIGLTNKSIQQKFGITQPDFGMLWNDKEVLNGGEISVKEIVQPKAEAEIAFVLGKDLNALSLTSIDVINAIDYALASIEIVGSRIKNWDIGITDTIADNASASHWVVGHRPVKLENFDMLNCKMIMEKNGQVVSEGVGRNCLQSPINAMLWLAQKMVELGRPMKAGEVILTGSLGPFIDIKAGDHFKANIEGLGEVSAYFTE